MGSIPSSGPVSISDFNAALGRNGPTSNSAMSILAVPQPGSLVYIAGQQGTLNQSAPHSFSEWYNYSSAATTTTTTSTTSTTTTIFSTTTSTTTTTTTLLYYEWCMGYGLADCCVAISDYNINCGIF